MAEVEKARHVLEGERKTVLAGLRKNRAQLDRRTQSLLEARTKLDLEMYALLLRGKTAGVSVVEMGKALGLTRQRTHTFIREAEAEAEQAARLREIIESKGLSESDARRALREQKSAEAHREREERRQREKQVATRVREMIEEREIEPWRAHQDQELLKFVRKELGLTKANAEHFLLEMLAGRRGKTDA